MAIQGGGKYNYSKLMAGVPDGQTKNVVSKLLVGATTASGYGVVASGTTGGSVDAPKATSVATDFVGVVVAHQDYAQTTDTTDLIPAGHTISVLTAGAIAVPVASDVAARGKVFLGVGADVAGKFTGAVGAAATLAVEIPNALFLTAAKSGGVAMISLKVGG